MTDEIIATDYRVKCLTDKPTYNAASKGLEICHIAEGILRWIVGMDRVRGIRKCRIDYGSADMYGESW